MVNLWSKEHVRLADHVTLSQADRDLLFCSDVVLKFPDCSRICLELAVQLRGGVSRSQIEAALTDADCKKVVETLMKLGYLVPVQANPWANEIYAKHFSYFEGIGLDPIEAQQRLLNSHLVLIGLGGTGSIVLQHLVGAGIGRYTLIDGDTVDRTNLNRQFIYRRDDVGRPKVEVAARYIRQRLPTAKVETRKGWVRSAADIEAMLPPVPSTMLINAADDPKSEIVAAVAGFCARMQVPFLGGGCGFQSGCYGPLVPPTGTDAYIESRKTAALEAAALGVVHESTQSVSFGPLNTIVGAFMARDILEYLVGGRPFSMDHHVWIDLKRPGIFRQPTRSGSRGQPQ
jgi:sulfur-carrier protein adenylyltransferase/sulfurtransferase